MLTQLELAEIRRRTISDEVTKEELVEAIKTLRQGRFKAAEAGMARKPKSAAAKAPVDFNKLLGI